MFLNIEFSKKWRFSNSIKEPILQKFNILRYLSYFNVDTSRLKLLFFHTGLIIDKNIN